MTITLHGTPLSHFTRKIRVLLHELNAPFDFVRAPGVLTTEPSSYGENPLLRVPALTIDGETLFESEHIARYLIAKLDPQDRLQISSNHIQDLNRLATANGIMANEVVLILAKRAGLAEPEKVAYFQKLITAIEGGLSWLEAHTDPDAGDFDYRDIALICMWQHLAHYNLVTLHHPKIAARVARFASRPSIARTTPQASLQEAEQR